jgi:hypothetical protein
LNTPAVSTEKILGIIVSSREFLTAASSMIGVPFERIAISNKTQLRLITFEVV